MFLCRVIMGNMELLHPGSKQFHPSSPDFDSGVDNLQKPRHFIVWSMNLNTHIYPEFVVSFKVSTDAEGDMLLLLSYCVFICCWYFIRHLCAFPLYMLPPQWIRNKLLGVNCTINISIFGWKI